jgi:hypothetical protein
MGVKYVKDFAYPKHMGFHAASEPMSKYGKGGSVKAVPSKAKDSYKDMPARAKPNAPAKGARKMESKPKMGKGQGYAEGGRVPGYDMDRLPAKKPPGRTMDLAPSKPERGEYQGYAKGGMTKGKSKIAKVMGEYKRGELHSGSKKGPKVKSREQAVAIALSEARKAGAKIPKKYEGGEIYSTEYLAYGDKKGPYRGSPKKAKMLGRQDRRAREAMERAEKYAPGMSLDMSGKVVKKAKGGGFPDLTGDGKVTRADVLKGRGVFKKGGMAKHKDVKMDKAMMKKAVHKHEKAMHPGKKLTKLSDGGVPSYGRKPMYGGGKC